MAKSLAASLTAAVRCDGYAGQSCCVPGSHTAPALEVLYQRAGRYLAGVVGVEFLTGGAPTADIIEYPGTARWPSTRLLDMARTEWPTPSARPWTGSTRAAPPDGTPHRTLVKEPP